QSQNSSRPEMEMSGAPGMPGRQQQQQRSGTVKRRRWGGLRQQWKLLGLFEIDQQHEFYSLTSMMKEGLAAAIQTTIDNPPTYPAPAVRLSADMRREYWLMDLFTFFLTTGIFLLHYTQGQVCATTLLQATNTD
ncbi:hypothetical protein XENORESO_008202, partial [Xenotaenia resolanae]